MRILKVGPNDAGQRMDKFLSKAVKGLPQSLMYKFLRTKKIKRNRKRAEPNDILVLGDEIQLFIKDEFFDSPDKDVDALEVIHPKLDIIFENKDILLLNKRPGVVVHEDDEGRDNTLVMHLKAYMLQKGEYDPRSEHSFAPALCNRIDRNTGGIVIAAKNAAALRDMNERIRNGEMSKYYLCAVHGIPKKRDEILKAYLFKNEKTNKVDVRDTPAPGYKEIVTGYHLIASRDGDSLLEIRLYTGRTQQIRAHMNHIGLPLLGEGKYGFNREDKKKGYRHQALYSYKLRFDFQKNGGPLDYLAGREFSLPTSEIWFYKDFV